MHVESITKSELCQKWRKSDRWLLLVAETLLLQPFQSRVAFVFLRKGFFLLVHSGVHPGLNTSLDECVVKVIAKYAGNVKTFEAAIRNTRIIKAS
jgi:hypothetical protein